MGKNFISDKIMYPQNMLVSDSYNSEEDIDAYICMIVREVVAKRKLLNYTQNDIAEKTGLKQSTISRVESLRVVPTLHVLIRIINVLGLELKLV